MTATLHVLSPTEYRLAQHPISQPPQSGNVTTADPAAIVRDLVRLAQRHDLPLPDDDALDLDTDIIATWPADLWTKAFRTIWATWRYRRMPTVGDFRAVIATDLAPPQPDATAASTPAGRPCSTKSTVPAWAPKTVPATIEDCIAALKDAGPGTRGTWWNRAKGRDPTLVSGDVTNFQRWVPLVAPSIIAGGLYAQE